MSAPNLVVCYHFPPRSYQLLFLWSEIKGRLHKWVCKCGNAKLVGIKLFFIFIFYLHWSHIKVTLPPFKNHCFDVSLNLFKSTLTKFIAVIKRRIYPSALTYSQYFVPKISIKKGYTQQAELD